MLDGDVWLRNARQANRAATQLADQLKREAKIDIVFPVEANAVFPRMHEQMVTELHARGWFFYKFIEPDVYRLMCAWSVREEEINRFVKDVKDLRRT